MYGGTEDRNMINVVGCFHHLYEFQSDLLAPIATNGPPMTIIRDKYTSVEPEKYAPDKPEASIFNLH